MNERLRNLINQLPATVPFVGPETLERANHMEFAARIGANENVFGPSPKAISAMQEEVPYSWKYGDPTNWDLRAAIANFHGVAMENVSVGAGIDSMLGLVCRMFLEPGDRVVSSYGGYPTFEFHVAGYGGELVTVPYVNDHEMPEHLVNKSAEVGAKLVYIANPDNPMGTWWPAETISEMIEAVPQQTTLVLDEAYVEFAPDGTAPPIDVSRPNLLRFRTFSKAYGMAGARVGYCLAEPSLIEAFDKIRDHFSINRPAQKGALAALGDQEYLRETVEKVARARNRIAAIAQANGLAALPSATNFVAVDCGRDADFAKAVLGHILSQNVFVRMPGVAPLSRCIRVSVGLDHHLDLFEEALSIALKKAAEGVPC